MAAVKETATGTGKDAVAAAVEDVAVVAAIEEAAADEDAGRCRECCNWCSTRRSC